jgi:hypothetical protein
MRSSGITLIAEGRAAQVRRARARALGWTIAAALSLGAIYASGDAIRLNPEDHAPHHIVLR